MSYFFRLFRWLAAGLVIGSLASPASAQTLHALVFADTDDPTIGNANQKTIAYLTNDLLPALAKLGGYNLSLSLHTGTNCRANILDTQLAALSPSPADVVLFYFTGHGWNNRQNAYPSLVLGNANTDRAALEASSRNLLDVYTRLRAKNPRLVLAIGESCNKERSDDPPAVVSSRTPIPMRNTAYNATRFKRLFGGYQGGIVLASSQRGQLSNCDPKGGIMSQALQSTLREWLSDGQTNALSWQVVMQSVTALTQKAAMAFGTVQQPMFQINLQAVRPHSGVAPLTAPPTTAAVNCPPVESYVNEIALAGIREDLPLLNAMNNNINSDNAEEYAEQFLTFYDNQRVFYANLGQMVFYEAAQMPAACRPEFDRNINWIRSSTREINERYSQIELFAGKPLQLAAQARGELPSLVRRLEEILKKFDK